MSKGQGFASLSKEKRTAIARLGGIAAHKKGTAHQWDAKEAQAAGRKGGLASMGARRKILTNQLPDPNDKGGDIGE